MKELPAGRDSQVSLLQGLLARLRLLAGRRNGEAIRCARPSRS